MNKSRIVVAVAAAGAIGFTGIGASFDNVVDAATSTIKNIKFKTLEGHRVTVTWDKFTNAKTYSVQIYEKNSKGTYVKKGPAVTTTSTSYTTNVLTDTGSYKVEITPYVKNAYATASKTTSGVFNVMTGAPAKVSNLKVSYNNTNKQTSLSWSKHVVATNYLVQIYKLNSKGAYVLDREKKVSTNSFNTTLPNAANTVKIKVSPIAPNGKVLTAVETVAIKTTYYQPLSQLSGERDKKTKKTTISFSPQTGVSSYQIELYKVDHIGKKVLVEKKDLTGVKNPTNESEALSGKYNAKYVTDLKIGEYEVRVTPYVNGKVQTDKTIKAQFLTE